MGRLSFKEIADIAISSPSKIVFLVIDGLGGLPHPDTGKTELETAHTPNLDRLAGEGIVGLMDPVSLGITPGSAPGHLAIFGYDPVAYTIGRGALEAVGIDFPLEDGDIAARGNFCTIDDAGLLADRRAGRISTAESARLCQLLGDIELSSAQVLVRPVKEHRLVVVFRGQNLSPQVGDSDPQRTGVAPKQVMPLSSEATGTAALANEFLKRARAVLSGQSSANMILLRGFARKPVFPSMREIYRLKPAAIAVYPMYRGIAKLIGMEVLPTGESVESEFATLAQHYQQYDFFFLHVKAADEAGEDGDFPRKVEAIERVDRALPRLLALNPDVLVVTGDHSTPAVLKGHSWHPVPVLLRSCWERDDQVEQFSERACSRGGLGRFPAVDLLPLAMANALKLGKFGA